MSNSYCQQIEFFLEDEKLRRILSNVPSDEVFIGLALSLAINDDGKVFIAATALTTQKEDKKTLLKSRDATSAEGIPTPPGAHGLTSVGDPKDGTVSYDLDDAKNDKGREFYIKFFK